MITARILLTIVASVCGAIIASAQTASADDYFNRAGKEYVKVDKRTALRTLDQGLREYPGDPRLLKLAEELLKEEQQKQQQLQKQQQEQQQKEQQQQQEEQQKQEQQKKEEQAKEQEAKEQKEQMPEPGRIAPQDAERILDALEREEKDVQQKVRDRQRPARRVPIEKDW